MTAPYVMYYFFYAGLLFPSVIRSCLLNWKPNDQDELNAKVLLKNRPTGSHGTVFINSDIHRTVYDMLLFSFALNWAFKKNRKQRKGKNVSARLLVPIDQKSCL